MFTRRVNVPQPGVVAHDACHSSTWEAELGEPLWGGGEGGVTGEEGRERGGGNEKEAFPGL